MRLAVGLAFGIAGYWLWQRVRRRELVARMVDVAALAAVFLLHGVVDEMEAFASSHREIQLLCTLAGLGLSVQSLRAIWVWLPRLRPKRALVASTGMWPLPATLGMWAMLAAHETWGLGLAEVTVSGWVVATSLVMALAYLFYRLVTALPQMSPNDAVQHLPWALTMTGFLVVMVAVSLAPHGVWAVGVYVVLLLTIGVMVWATERSSRFELTVEAAGSDSVMALRDALFLLTPDHLVDYANPAAMGMLGRDPTGVHFGALCPAWPCAGQTLLVRSDTRTLPVVIGEAPLLIDGELVGVAVSATDVTELQEALEAADEATELARRAAAARRDFLAVMSHEIRTPLNAVLGLAHLLEETQLEGQQRSWVETICRSSDDLLTILNDILDFSRIESGRLALESIPFSIETEVRSVVSIVQNQATAKGLRLSTDVENVPSWVQSDPTRLRQILLNLLSNAIKFTERGSVHATVRGDASGVVIVVQDSGIGISKDRLSTLFDAFTQADASTTRRFGGTGLGLAISQRLTELLGGTIRVESELGRGSTFTVRLPFEACDAPAAVVEETDDAGFEDLRVLLVEDNVVNRQVMKAILGRVGVTPDEAEDGEKGVALVLDGTYDVVLMDLQMPVMDGFDAMRAITERLGDARPFLVSHSASVAAQEAERATASGAHAHLPKPASPMAVRATLSAARAWSRAGRQGRAAG
ncbi:MAG: ATP-binding protein [Myxococcota bacterium]